MSSTFDRRVEPGFGPAPTSVGVWMYRRRGQDQGPVTDEQLQSLIVQKVIDRSTQVWRSEFGGDWKRLDQTSLWKEPSSPPPEAVPVSRPQVRSVSVDNEQNVGGRWDATFARMKEGEKGFYTFSFIGLILGPIYYMYLHMWRMAFAIIGFSLVSTAVAAIIEHATAINLGRFVEPAMFIFCALHVKKDYFRFKCAGEHFWPRIDSLANTGALAALIIVSLAVTGLPWIVPVGSLSATHVPSASTVPVEQAGLPAAIKSLPVVIDVDAMITAEHLLTCQGPPASWDNCRGTTTDEGHNQLSGRFEQGQLVKGTIHIVQDSERFLKGSFKNRLLEGLGEVDEQTPIGGARYVGYFSHGRQNGFSVAYHGNDAGGFAGNYVNGKKDGAFYAYDASYKVLATRVYKNGVETEYDANGIITEKGNEERYAKACRDYVSAAFTKSSNDDYGARIQQKVASESIMTYGARQSILFNGRRYEPFAAFMDYFKDGQLTDRKDLPFKYCIFGEGTTIISLDTKERL